MNAIATIVKKLCTHVGARPASFAAAATLPVTSLIIAHQGFKRALPTDLVDTGTWAMVGLEFAQWISLGRLAELEDARDDERATALKWQMAGIGCVQVVGYTFAVLGHAAAKGQDWSAMPAILAVIAFGAFFAWLNVSMKWTIADPVTPKGRRTASGAAIGPIGIAAKALPDLSSTSADDDGGPDGGQRAAQSAGDNIFAFTRPAREVAGYSQERRGLDEILREVEAGRQAKLSADAARRDPATGRWSSAAKPRRRRAA